MEHIPLWEKEEYTYPAVGAFVPTITPYIHDDDIERPAILIIPGGAYYMVWISEGEPVAKKFFDMGYQTFVVTYTTNVSGHAPVKFQAMKDVAKAIAYVRKNSDKYKVIPDKIAICGFSAGGHLCASMTVHFDEKQIQLHGEYEGINIRPDAAILSYPVISAGEYSHWESFEFLLGKEMTKDEIEYMSLEKQVKPDTPPCFLWHTIEDGLVPVENSLLFAAALKESGVEYEFHSFTKGNHGLSLANGELNNMTINQMYCMKQTTEYISYCVENDMEMIPMYSMFAALPKGLDYEKEYFERNIKSIDFAAEPGVEIWTTLADNWLKKFL